MPPSRELVGVTELDLRRRIALLHARAELVDLRLGRAEVAVEAVEPDEELARRDVVRVLGDLLLEQLLRLGPLLLARERERAIDGRKRHARRKREEH
jgi:hypothetical protein